MSPITPKQKQVLEYVLKFRERKGYAPSQHEIARHFGFSSLGTVQNYLVRLERQGALQKSWNARRGIEITPSQSPLIPTTTTTVPGEDRPNFRDQVIELPLVGRVAAGRPIEALEHQKTFEVPLSLLKTSPLEHFVLQVNGDSMIGEGILDGDYVIIKKQLRAENGQTVVALLQNEATIKKFYQLKDRVELRAANPNYDPIVVKSLVEGNAFDFKIEGVLVGLIRKLD